MKRKLKRLSAAVAAVVLIAAISVMSVFAGTYFVYNNYSICENDDGGASLHDYTEDIESLVIPDELLGLKVTRVDAYAFAKRTDLKSVTFNESMKIIEYCSFSCCPSLVELNFSNDITDIGMSAFQDCDALVDVDLGVTKLAQVAGQLFYKCDSLERVVLPETCTSIGSYAFAECPSLEYVYVPASVTEIKNSSFQNSPNVAIYGSSGSYAEQYAQEKGIEFVSVDKYKPGDVNLDGRVNIKDVTLYQLCIVELSSFNKQQFYLADLNGDGVYNISDATEIQILIVNE